MRKRPGFAVARSARSNRVSTEPARDWPNCFMSTAQKISAPTKRRERCSQAAVSERASSYVPFGKLPRSQIAKGPARPQSHGAFRTTLTLTTATVQLIAHALTQRLLKLRRGQLL